MCLLKAGSLAIDLCDPSTSDFSGKPKTMSYAVRDEYIYKIRRLRVICIGAGLTGIAAVHKLRTKHSDLEIDFAIYEKNHDVGGTWLENRYPGCACDVPAHSV